MTSSIWENVQTKMTINDVLPTLFGVYFLVSLSFLDILSSCLPHSCPTAAHYLQGGNEFFWTWPKAFAKHEQKHALKKFFCIKKIYKVAMKNANFILLKNDSVVYNEDTLYLQCWISTVLFSMYKSTLKSIQILFMT